MGKRRKSFDERINKALKDTLGKKRKIRENIFFYFLNLKEKNK